MLYPIHPTFVCDRSDSRAVRAVRSWSARKGSTSAPPATPLRPARHPPSLSWLQPSPRSGSLSWSWPKPSYSWWSLSVKPRTLSIRWDLGLFLALSRQIYTQAPVDGWNCNPSKLNGLYHYPEGAQPPEEKWYSPQSKTLTGLHFQAAIGACVYICFYIESCAFTFDAI